MTRKVALAENEHVWHAMTPDEVCAYWQTDARRGLSASAAEERVQRLGRNVLPAPPRPSPIRRFFSQFADPLVAVLLGAAVVAALVAMLGPEAHGSVLARFGDTMAIALIVLLNASLGFVQERRAEAALDALQKMTAPNARVIRDGHLFDTRASELVPGDLVRLEAGDAVPADVRLVETVEAQTEESALTGESTPVTKHAERSLDEESPLADRSNMAYMGVTFVRGHARAVVVQTGAQTELGRIGALIRATKRDETPLEQRLARFGRAILVACLTISALLFALRVAQGSTDWTLMLLTAVSLAVAAIPEGLPAITTITLALGMQRMATRGAIVRKLAAVETLGSATVICTDKTGTLTENAMTVRLVETVDEILNVTGSGYSPEGGFERDGASLGVRSGPVERLLRTAALCNDATLARDEHGVWTVVGDPTEGALLTLAAKNQVVRADLLQTLTVVQEVPFDSDRKRMAVVVEDGDGKKSAHVKGSPDVLLPLCTHVCTRNGIVSLSDAERTRLLTRNEEHASNAYRVLALAENMEPGRDPEQNLTFLGFTAMIDPPRPEVRDAVKECREAGIRVVMITGDHKLTAVAIARELGFFGDDDIALTGADIDAFDDDAFLAMVNRAAVFARVTAEQKLRIVRALKRNGHVAAMTGDGVNDAPALREAQIGIAMGRGGTDVAREAGDMVLADDNFATIVHAIREGRAIYRNIQKFIFFLNSSNAGLVVAVVAASFVPWIPQLTPLQLLWINLVTNGLPALALGVDPPVSGQMREAPRPPEEGLLGARDYAGILLVGVMMGGSALGVYWLPDLAPWLFQSGTREGRLVEARSMAFTVLAISPLFHAFNCRSPTEPVLRSGLFTNRWLWAAVGVSAAVQLATLVLPVLHPMFKTEALNGREWLVLLFLAFTPVLVVDVLKRITNRPPRKGRTRVEVFTAGNPSDRYGRRL